MVIVKTLLPSYAITSLKIEYHKNEIKNRKLSIDLKSFLLLNHLPIKNPYIDLF